MKPRDFLFVAFGFFLSISAGFTAGAIAWWLMKIATLSDPLWAIIPAFLAFAGTLFYIDRPIGTDSP